MYIYIYISLARKIKQFDWLEWSAYFPYFLKKRHKI